MVDVLETARTAASAPATRAPKRGPGPAPYLFLLPYLVLFLTFTLVPAGYGLWISLHEWDYLLPGKPFVGKRKASRVIARVESLLGVTPAKKGK